MSDAPGSPRYHQLVVWQGAMALAQRTYQLTQSFPSTERYGLAQQLRRAAVSCMANIAEGNFRLHLGDYIHHVSIARGSLGEVRALFELSGRLDFIEPGALRDTLAECDRTARQLTSLARALRARQTRDKGGS